MPCGSNALCIPDLNNGHDFHLCFNCQNFKTTMIDKDSEICIECMKFKNCRFVLKTNFKNLSTVKEN